MTGLTLAALTPWLTANVPGFTGPITGVQKFDVGQSNPTYRLTTPGKSYVLRRKPPGVLLKSAHAVDREFRVQQALCLRMDCVCNVHALCMDDSVIGSAFYVMDFVDGRGFTDPSLPGLTAPERTAIFDEMNRVLAAIHDIDIDAAGLSDYGPPGHYYERQLARWTKQYRTTETSEIKAMDDLIDWLREQMPADDGQRTLVHGDYRIDNLLFAKDSAQCRAVLDWELSTLGHPFADLAGVIMQWQLPPGDEGRGLANVDRQALGIPSDSQFIEAYCTRRNLARPARFGYYIAFAFFRMAAILQGVKKRALDGNASNPEKALKLGAYVPKFAQLGLEARNTYG